MGPVLKAPVSYRSWNDALVAHYFNEDLRDRPAYLSVDDDDLAEIAQENEWDAGAASLACAVRQRLGAGSTLYSVSREAREWRQAGTPGTPPFVAFLALCVLAGSRMAADSDAGIAGHAYYARLNQLLGRDTHAGQPSGFETLGDVWENLNLWLGEGLDGRIGLPTARTRPHPRHIWWPISQCLLRAADRRRLPDFFGSVRLDPGTDISEPQLWTLLHNWANPGCGLTRQGLRTIELATDDVADQVTSIVKRELEAWDGELRDSHGRRRAEVMLIAEKLAGGRRVTLRFVARRPEGFPEADWVNPVGEEIALRVGGEHWFGPLPIAVTARTLRDGFKLTSGKFALSYEPSKAIPLRASYEPVSGWLSARQASAVEEHLLLAHSSVEDQLRAFLRRHAQSGWQLVRPEGNVPDGWLVGIGVHITGAVLHAPPELSRLAPRLNTATSMEGGLEVARGQYLVGGEPDLWITVAEGETCDVAIDSAVERFKTGVIPLHLSELGFAPGRHTISAGGITRSITTFGGFPVIRTVGTGSLGHEFHRHAHYRPATIIAGETELGKIPTGTVQLSGALIVGRPDDLPVSRDPPILLRSGFRYVLIGARPGEILTVRRTRDPEWLTAVGLGAQFFDCPAPFPVQWLIRYGTSETKIEPAAAGSSPPRADEAIGGEPTQLWAAVIRNAAETGSIAAGDEELWQFYIDVARQLTCSGVTE